MYCFKPERTDDYLVVSLYPEDLIFYYHQGSKDLTFGVPSRFTAEAKASRHPFVYLPFGAGPRNCVGMRLAQLEIRMALVHLFRQFNIVVCSETKVGWLRKTRKKKLVYATMNSAEQSSFTSVIKKSLYTYYLHNSK